MPRGRPPIPDEKRQAIVATTVEKRNASEAARVHGVDQSTALKFAKEAGVKLLKGHHVPTPKISGELRQAIEETLEKIPIASHAARIHGVSGSTIRQAAKRAGIALQGRTGRPRKSSRNLKEPQEPQLKI